LFINCTGYAGDFLIIAADIAMSQGMPPVSIQQLGQALAHNLERKAELLVRER
jgi:hypothetical protein